MTYFVTSGTQNLNSVYHIDAVCNTQVRQSKLGDERLSGICTVVSPDFLRLSFVSFHFLAQHLRVSSVKFHANEVNTGNVDKFGNESGEIAGHL